MSNHRNTSSYLYLQDVFGSDLESDSDNEGTSVPVRANPLLILSDSEVDDEDGSVMLDVFIDSEDLAELESIYEDSDGGGNTCNHLIDLEAEEWDGYSSDDDMEMESEEEGILEEE